MNPAAFASLPASACTPGPAGAEGPDRIARTLYDAAGQRLQLREGVGTPDEGTEATWAYNLNGQVTTLIDGNGNRAELRYDGHGRQDRWTFPSATRPASFNDATPTTALATAGSTNAADYEEYGYDPNGNRTSLRKRDGSILGYSFDALNRMTVKTVPERATGPYPLTAAQTRDVFYSYDLRGLQLSARFDSQAGEGIANAYDGFGRLASSSTDMGGVARTLAYAHDRNGNRTRITHPDGQWFATDYDALDRPYWLHGTGGGIAQSYFTPAGALADLNRVGSTFTHIGYDAVQRPTWRGHFFTGADNVHFSYSAAWSYAFNPAGQIGAVTRDNDDFAWRRHYGVNRAYATNGLNQYTAAGPANFAYDPNGNLIADGTTTYGYDIENRMVAGPNGATLSYDPLGRLFQVTGSAPLATVTRFLYDGDALVAEYDPGSGSGTGGSNEMIRRHVHWVGADVPLATYEDSGFGALRQAFADHQGSIVALADTGGHVVAINTYDEYGFPGVTNNGRFQYTGQAWIPELGMYYYKARIYSPALGRFMQTDPVGYQGGINLYAYVGNDPVNATDPTGRQGCSDAGQNTSGGGDQSVLTGACVQASAFNARIDRSMSTISSAEIDQSARENMHRIQNDRGPNENIAQFDQQGSAVTFTPLTATTTEGAGTTQGRAHRIGNPEAVGHSQPDLVPIGGSPRQNLAPGYENRNAGDHLQVNAGRANYIINRGIVIVVERSQGQFRARVISGTPSPTQLREIRSQLNRLQRGSR